MEANQQTKTPAKQSKKGREGFMTTGKERFSYGLYFLGQNIFYIFLYLYLSVFFTDVGIPALTVAAVALVVKVWDAVNDPIFGGIVDGVKLKKGKFLPWLRISLFAIPVTTILIFAIPSTISLTAKIVWAVVSYMLWDTAYTICDVPIFGLITVMTDNQSERTSLMAIGRVCAMIASVIVAMGVPTVRTAIGGWLPTIVVLSIIAFITMVPICFTAKERIAPPKTEKGVSLKEMFRYLGHNKYLLIFYLALFISYSTNLSTTLAMYFARHCLGQESLQSILSLAMLVPAIILGMFIPGICKKVDKFTLYFWATVATVVLGVIQYFVGYANLGLFLAITFLKSLPLGITTVLMYMFTPDCAEYGRYKTGVDAVGVTFSIQTFSVKLMTAVATALGTLFLGLIGFVEGEGAVQAAGFADKLWFVYALIPIIGAAISLIVLRMYKLRDKDVQIMAKCNAGEITREEAEAQLGGKFN